MVGVKPLTHKLGAFLSLILGPSRIKNRLLSRIPNWSVSPTASVGHSYIDSQFLTLQEGARIGTLSVVRALVTLELGINSSIGNLNFISAAKGFNYNLPNRGSLRIGNESSITNRHYFDCSGGIILGELTTFAGVRSTVLTHQIDLEENVQSLESVIIGSKCFLSSDIKIVPGSVLPDDSVLAMGAVLIPGLNLRGRLYGGVPAKEIGIAKNAGYIRRVTGKVHPRPGD